MVIADLDHFKSINDRLGHAAGDDVLRRFTSSHPELDQVSASFGIALLEPGDSWSATLARADAALYRAKHAGRNRVLLDQEIRSAAAAACT